MLCKYCGQEIPDDNQNCPDCEEEVVLENPEEFVDCDQPNTPPTGNQGRRWPFVLAGIVLILALIFFLTDFLKEHAAANFSCTQEVFIEELQKVCEVEQIENLSKKETRITLEDGVEVEFSINPYSKKVTYISIRIYFEENSSLNLQRRNFIDRVENVCMIVDPSYNETGQKELQKSLETCLKDRDGYCSYKSQYVSGAFILLDKRLDFFVKPKK